MVGVDVSSPIVEEDKLDKTSDGKPFLRVRKQPAGA